METEDICPLCEQGRLHEHSEWLEVEYNGQTGTVPSLYSVCDSCGSQQALPEQTRYNKRQMMVLRTRVDGRFASG